MTHALFPLSSSCATPPSRTLRIATAASLALACCAALAFATWVASVIKRDASIVFGLNPAQLIYDPSKIALVQKAMTVLADLIN